MVTTRAEGKAAGTLSSIWLWRVAMAIFATLLLVPLARVWEVAPDIAHGWAAPILVAYLWWERWSERPSLHTPAPNPLHSANRWFLAAMGLALLAIPLRLALTPFPIWPAALIGYLGILLIIALLITHRFWGKKGVVWLAGPLTLLPGVMPWPSIFERNVILPLRHGIASLITEVSNLLGQPAMASGTSVRLAEHWIGIDEACGGIRSMQACVTTALFFGEWLKLSIQRRLLLVGVGVLAALVGNLGRVGILTWSATGPEGRFETWHDPAGWMALGFSLVMTGWVGWRWSNGGKVLSQPPPNPTRSRALVSAFNWKVGAILALLVAAELGTRGWYARGQITTLSADTVALWTVRIPTDSKSFVRQELSDAARDLLQPDAFLSGSWRGPDGHLRMVNYVEWHQGQAARSTPFVHNPTVCLPHAGAELERELGVIEIPWDGEVVPFHTFLFRQGGELLAVGYTIWDPSRGIPMPLPSSGGTRVGWIREQWREIANAREHQPAQLLAFGIIGAENYDLIANEIRELMIPTDQIGFITRSSTP
ncbi:MAG: hypothetical protein SynsKO_33040 [Synoicihabitans sp.]